MDKPIIFIIVDSVRSFDTKQDDRDKLPIMEDFGKEAVEFTNAFCSAPSSIMSASSMFTGISSAYIARNYHDWKFEEGTIVSLQSILKKRGYKIFSIDNSKESREMMQSLTLPLKKKYLPKNYSHADFWTNKDLCKILKNLFENHNIPKKSFFMLWFDCRKDPSTSNCVKETLEIFKKNNFYDDSIIFLTSDHGYPVASSGLNENTMKGIGHDMIITDDNIKIPLYLKYPGCNVEKIESLVGNVDLTPTILDLLNIDFKELSKNVSGKSLLRIKENKDLHDKRVLRIDTRLFSQNNRITALRSTKHKYVFYNDQEKHEIFDMIKDPNEIAPLNLENKENLEILSFFKKKYLESEKIINGYHCNEIFKNISLIKNNLKKAKEILIVTKIPTELLKIIIDQIKNINTNIKLFYPSTFKDSKNLFSKIEFIDVNSLDKIKFFDIAFIIKEKTTFSFVPKNLIDHKKLKFKKLYYFDYNMKKLNPLISKWFWPLWKYSLNYRFYLDEPKLLFIDSKKISKTLLNKYVLNKEEKIDIYQQKQLRDRTMLNKDEKL